MMPKKNAVINFEICFPHRCDETMGICQALSACKKRLLEQESPFEPPYLLSGALCHGCAACKHICPLQAIDII